MRAKWGKEKEAEEEAVQCELEGTGKPAVKNLFVVQLWQNPDLKKLIRDLRKYILELPYPHHRLAVHYSKPGFVYQTVSMAKAKIFLEQTRKGQEGLDFSYRALTTGQREDLRQEFKEKARDALVYFHAKTKAKREALEEAALEAESDKLQAKMQRDMDTDVSGQFFASAKAFPDVHRELLSIHATEDVVVVELRIQGTHKGRLTFGSKTVAPTGLAIDAPCVDIFHLENGKITSFNCYNLPSVMQQQLGLVGD